MGICDVNSVEDNKFDCSSEVLLTLLVLRVCGGLHRPGAAVQHGRVPCGPGSAAQDALQPSGGHAQRPPEGPAGRGESDLPPGSHLGHGALRVGASQSTYAIRLLHPQLPARWHHNQTNDKH